MRWASACSRLLCAAEIGFIWVGEQNTSADFLIKLNEERGESKKEHSGCTYLEFNKSAQGGKDRKNISLISLSLASFWVSVGVHIQSNSLHVHCSQCQWNICLASCEGASNIWYRVHGRFKVRAGITPSGRQCFCFIGAEFDFQMCFHGSITGNVM